MSRRDVSHRATTSAPPDRSPTVAALSMHRLNFEAARFPHGSGAVTPLLNFGGATRQALWHRAAQHASVEPAAHAAGAPHHRGRHPGIRRVPQPKQQGHFCQLGAVLGVV